jgi:hypothetical protein
MCKKKIVRKRMVTGRNKHVAGNLKVNEKVCKE